VKEITFRRKILPYLQTITASASRQRGRAAMTARFDRAWIKASRANLAVSVGLLLITTATRSASGAPAEREQCKARRRASEFADRSGHRLIKALRDPELDGAVGSPGWIRTSDHSINSRMLYR
jgi:hypothetical protein